MVVLAAYCRGKTGKANGFRRERSAKDLSGALAGSERTQVEESQCGHFPVKIDASADPARSVPASWADGRIVGERARPRTPANKRRQRLPLVRRAYTRISSLIIYIAPRPHRLLALSRNLSITRSGAMPSISPRVKPMSISSLSLKSSKVTCGCGRRCQSARQYRLSRLEATARSKRSLRHRPPQRMGCSSVGVASHAPALEPAGNVATKKAPSDAGGAWWKRCRRRNPSARLLPRPSRSGSCGCG
ncbi:hypothetical protein IQ17_00894 [Bradyrhizobium daqingense]|uniref:Uncharacterized protein n=1 Tax=Bradyrhizobium daqingense TaxID=993502 RepID=A0A562LQA2_9BRAD|nr:hypothetical protein IQ17_00894 [Bradyrhizobium daqingense]